MEKPVEYGFRPSATAFMSFGGRHVQFIGVFLVAFGGAVATVTKVYEAGVKAETEVKIRDIQAETKVKIREIQAETVKVQQQAEVARARAEATQETSEKF
jgi:hypothetical protein